MKKMLFLFLMLSIPSMALDTSGKLLFKVDPYSIRTDQNEIILKFQLNLKTYLQIKNNNKVVVSNFFSAGNIHEINLGIQDCNERFFIEVNKEKSKFITHKKIFIPPFPCDLKGKITFGFLGDTQQFNYRHRKIAKMVGQLQKKEDFLFILNLGDVVNYGFHKFQWDNFFNVANLYSDNAPLVAAIGNHEYYNLLAKPMKDNPIPYYFGKYFRWNGAPVAGYYYLNMKRFALMVINSNFEHLTPEEQEGQWREVEKKLRENQIPTIIAMHYSPFSSDVFNKSSQAELLRKRLVPLIEKYQVKLVLTGHNHVYERLLRNGINYIVTGPSGGAWSKVEEKNPYQVIVKPKTLTFGKVTIDEKEINVFIYNESGEIIDRVNQKL